MPENPQEETIKKGGIESAFDSISPIGDSSREDVLTKREIIEAEYADNESVIEKIKGIAAAMGFNLTKTVEPQYFKHILSEVRQKNIHYNRRNL